MTDVYAQPGTEKYVKFAKTKLSALSIVREGIGLPVLRKHFVPEDGVRIDIESSVYGDRVRIFGGVGWPKGLSLPSGWGPIQRVASTPAHAWEYLGVSAYITKVGPSSDPSHDIGAAFGTMECGYVDTAGVTTPVGTFDCPFFAPPGPFFFTGTISPLIGGIVITGTGIRVFDNTPLGLNSVIAAGMEAANRAVAAATFLPWTAAVLTQLQAGVTPSGWQAVILAHKPVNEAHPDVKGVKVTITMIAPHTLEPWWTEDPALPSAAADTTIAVYGTATFRYAYLTGALTFESWVPKRDAHGAVITAKNVPAPAGVAWPDYNAVVTYKPLTWASARVGAAAAKKARLDPASGNYDPYLTAALSA